MLAQVIAVHPDIGDKKSSVEFQKQAATGIGVVRGNMGSVPADAAVVIIAAVLAIEVVPGVRQIYQRPTGVIEAVRLRAGDILPDEAPARVERKIGAMREGRGVGGCGEKKGMRE